MVGWHTRLNGHEFEQAPGDGEGQGSLVSCSPWPWCVCLPEKCKARPSFLCVGTGSASHLVVAARVCTSVTVCHTCARL